SSTDSSPPLSSTFSLHDALPISARHLLSRLPLLHHLTLPYLPLHLSLLLRPLPHHPLLLRLLDLFLPNLHPNPSKSHRRLHMQTDRKSTRLNSSHVSISYAVFCF